MLMNLLTLQLYIIWPVIQECHQRVMHSGVNATFTEVCGICTMIETSILNA